MIELLPPVPPRNGCLNCAPKPDVLKLTTRLAVGFGIVIVTKDENVFWRGDSMHVSVGMIERMAYSFDMGDHHQKKGCTAPREQKYDWRIKFDAPLAMNVYQRQGREKWVCVETGPGFA